MFGVKYQYEAHVLQQENRRLQQAVQGLRAELAAERERSLAARSRLEAMQIELGKCLLKFGEAFLHSTAEISNLATLIQDETGRVRHQIEACAQNPAAHSRDGASGMFALSRLMDGVISASTLRSFTEVAKIDHLVYKFEIYKIFMGLSQKEAVDLADHTRCRLGSWYYQGEGRDCFSRLPGYRDMEGPHRRFHEAGRAAVDCFHSGQHDEGFAAIARMEAASTDVLADLERMALSGETDASLLCRSQVR
ncbi:MAG: CZB domain-containing protein [Sulfuricella sp.]|nr:CZB domain-containing protein [Sulfuricella sp.]